MMKVVKFGGTSLASAEQIRKVFDIVVSDQDRKIVVVSAPGKRYSADTKITDMLITCGKNVIDKIDAKQTVDAIVMRYEEIAKELVVSLDIVEEIRGDLDSTLNGNTNNQGRFLDSVMALGENSCAKLVAAFFVSQGVDAKYINPKDAGLIVSDEPGNAQVLPESYSHLENLRSHTEILIFPGFFGYSKNGDVVTFPRSGSDITGSVLARGIGASLYENFTDVDAVYSVNPNIVPNPKAINEITYKEMRELSYAGFGVFHDEALAPAFQAGITVNIKNTNNPSAPGTFIVKERSNIEGPVSGIASDTGFCVIYVSKYLMNREVGFGRRLLHILEDFNISYEHMPSGIDDISVIVRQNQITEEMERIIIDRIYTELQADDVKIQRDLSLIMIVGLGMRQSVGTTARAATALARHSINIEQINHGSSEVSIMFGIKEKDEKRAVSALYQEFFVNVPSITF
jgi:aspartate kinase